MADKKSQGTHLVAAFAGFGLTGLTAWLLLVTALVVWLTDVLNSLIWSSLIVGGFLSPWRSQSTSSPYVPAWHTSGSGSTRCTK